MQYLVGQTHGDGVSSAPIGRVATTRAPRPPHRYVFLRVYSRHYCLSVAWASQAPRHAGPTTPCPAPPAPLDPVHPYVRTRYKYHGPIYKASALGVCRASFGLPTPAA